MLHTRLRRDLRSVFAEGVFWSVMVGTGETWFPAFALAVGLSEVWAGLMATIPLLAGALLQLLSPFLVARLRSRRRATVVTACLQAVSLAPLLFGAATGRLSGPVLLLAAALYWGAGQGTGTIWNAWMTQVIPPAIRHRFFARRGLVTQLGIVLGLVGGGLGLQAAHASGRTLLGFLILFAVAAASRFSSALFLARISERHIPGRDQVVAGRQLLRRVRSADGRLLLFLILMTGSVAVASPFFTPYMLGPLELSYREYMALIACSFLVKAFALSALGDLARRFGAGRLLLAGSILVTVVPVLWIFGRTFVYLLCLQALSGAAWATYEFAAFLLFLDSIREEERTSLLTTLNLASAVTMVAGSLLGGALLSSGDGSVTAYLVLFLVSGMARGVVTLFLLRYALRKVAVPAVVFRVLSLRPSAGAIIRPLWASLKFPSSHRGDRS
jgi:MFS family permease